MNIRNISIGGWFQRTTLHLAEIYDFLQDASSGLELDKVKLKKLQQDLHIESLALHYDDLEYITFSSNGIDLKITEDGLITLSLKPQGHIDVQQAVKDLADYYEKKLSPAFQYLFSLGAPVPKELANIKNVYPYFIVLQKGKQAHIEQLLQEFQENRHSQVSGKAIDIIRGDKLYIINIKTDQAKPVDRFIEEQVFQREFKGQLHRYINLHRIIWEKIAEVKERGNIKGNNVDEFQKKVEGYAKTINLIESRISQMGTYLSTREQIAQNDPQLKDFAYVVEYRYETLADTLSYVEDIWKMTSNYVDSALKVFTDIRSKATQGSVKDLALITSMGVGATLIGLVTKTDLPAITIAGLGYFIIVIGIAYTANRAIKWSSRRKVYKISDVEFDKNID